MASELLVNKITPESGTTLTLGESGDTISFASGVLPTLESLTITGDLTVDTNTLYVDSTNNEVGIGTSSPAEKLEVYGTEASGGVEILLTNEGDGGISTTPYTAIRSRLNSIRNGGEIRFGRDSTYGSVSDSDSNIQFYTAVDDVNTERMRINSSGNVGIGTSSPSTKLDVEGTGVPVEINSSNSNAYKIQFADNGAVRGYIGSSSGVPFRFANESASELMRITSAGNVGIGTSSPSFILDITEDGGGAAARINLVNTGVATNDDTLLSFVSGSNDNENIIYFGDADDTNVGQISYDHASDSMEFYTNASEAMRIDSSGNVGIGISSPSVKLHVIDNTGSLSATPDITAEFRRADGTYNPRLQIRHSTTGSDINHTYSSSAPNLTFSIAGNEAMRINSSGQVGIGTTSPASLLEVEGTSTTAKIHIQSTSAGASSFDGSGAGLLLTAGGMNTTSKFTPAIQFGTTDPSITTTNPKVGAAINAMASEGFFADTDGGMDLAFYTTPNAPGTGQTTTERMRIDNSGNVGIGTSSPTVKLHVDGNALIGSNVNGSESSPYLELDGAGYNGFHWLDGTAYYIGQNSNSRSLRIYSGSNEAAGAQLSAGGTSFGTYSDERLKKDITDLTNGLNKILALRPVNFKYKFDADDYKTRIGIIAQSLVGQVDEALDLSRLNDTDTTEYYNVRYQDLIPVLVKGMQEQQTKIQELEARITTLEANNP